MAYNFLWCSSQVSCLFRLNFSVLRMPILWDLKFLTLYLCFFFAGIGVLAEYYCLADFSVGCEVEWCCLAVFVGWVVVYPPLVSWQTLQECELTLYWLWMICGLGVCCIEWWSSGRGSPDVLGLAVNRQKNFLGRYIRKRRLNMGGNLVLLWAVLVTHVFC